MNNIKLDWKDDLTLANAQLNTAIEMLKPLKDNIDKAIDRINQAKVHISTSEKKLLKP